MITNENLELLKQAQLEGKTIEEIVAEAEAMKSSDSKLIADRNSAILKLETLVAKIRNKEYDNHLEAMNYIIAKELLAGSVYQIIDTTPKEEIIEEEIFE